MGTKLVRFYSKNEFANRVIKFSFFILLFQIFLGAIIVPFTQDKARSYIRTSKIDLFPSLIEQKKFVDTVSNLTIFVDKKDKKSGELKNIFLKDTKDKKNTQIIYAKRGRILNNGGINSLILINGKIINFNNGKKKSFDFKQTEFNLSNYVTKSTTYPKIQEISSLNFSQCIYNIYFNNYIPFANILQLASNKKIKEMHIIGNNISGIFSDGTSFVSYVKDPKKFIENHPSTVTNSTLSHKQSSLFTFIGKNHFSLVSNFCNQDNLKNVIQELLKRIYLPLYIPLLSLIASMIILSSKSKVNFTSYKIKLFITGFLVLVISEISIRFAGSSELKNDIIFLILPIILFVIFYKIFKNKLKLNN